MNYNTTEVHNVAIGEDVVWYNIEINDLNAEQRDAILAVLTPFYERELTESLAEHIAFENERRRNPARTG
jgi:hypothetical protein